MSCAGILNEHPFVGITPSILLSMDNPPHLEKSRFILVSACPKHPLRNTFFCKRPRHIPDPAHALFRLRTRPPQLPPGPARAGSRASSRPPSLPRPTRPLSLQPPPDSTSSNASPSPPAGANAPRGPSWADGADSDRRSTGAPGASPASPYRASATCQLRHRQSRSAFHCQVLASIYTHAIIN